MPVLPDAVFAAVSLQRLRLRHDQQVPDCTGGRGLADGKSGG